jgi:heat shock protein HslJ
MRNLTLGIAASLFLSCSDSATGPEPSEGVEGSWNLYSYQFAGGPVGIVSESGSYTVEFTADGRVGVRADCNRCSSSYSASGPPLMTLDIGNLACTRAYCGEASLFDAYTIALGGASSFERSSSGLLIWHPNGSLRFVPGS